MSEDDKKDIIAIIECTIDSRVNGKIDRLQDHLDTHMEEIEPMLDLIKGSMVIGKVIIWFSSLILAIGATIAMVKSALK